MVKSSSTRAALLPYPIIAAAVRGEPDAVNTVIRHYSGYIAALSTRTSYDVHGCPYSAMWDPQLLEVLRSLSPSSRSIFAVESLKSATRNFEKLMDILEFLLTHDLKFASTNFYIENGHVERRIKPLRAGHTSKEIQKNLSQTAGLGYRHAAALNQL